MRIRILDRAGKPVREATLACVRSSVPFPEIALLPDADGVVELGLPAGTYTFRAQGPGDASAEVQVASDGATPEEATATLD